jgi:phage terminase large subunit-like protein
VALATAPLRARTRTPLRPFTVPHFREWARRLILDNDEPWTIEPFQAAFLRDVFAGVPETWLVVPEGNGKTTLLAGLALYHCEHRPGASVPVAASSRDQAQFLYQQAEGFVLRSPYLSELVYSQLQATRGKRKTEVQRFLTRPGYRRIDHADGGRMQVFAADDRTGDGAIPTLALIDELHRHRDLRLYRTWRGKLGKRGGQIVTISTAGEPGAEFEQTRERIRQQAPDNVRRGSFIRAASSGLVLHEWAVPEDGDVEDMRVVKAANPFSGITLGGLREKRTSPTMTLEHWRRFVCNLPTRSTAAAITEAEWFGAAGEGIPAGQPVWLGLDVAWKWDTTAAVPFWMPGPREWVFGPATILEPPRDGSMLSGDAVEGALLAIHQRNPIETVVMDTSRAEQLGRWLEDEIGANVIERPQTIPAEVEEYDRFMEALRMGWLKHSGDPGLTRHALNAIARMLPRGDHVFDRPFKGQQADQNRRVFDALKAASMVLAEATVEAPVEEPIAAWA